MATGTGGERRRGIGLMLSFMLLLFGLSSFLYESLGVYSDRAGANVPPRAFAAVFAPANGADLLPALAGNRGAMGFAGTPGGLGAGPEGVGPGGTQGTGFTATPYDPFAETSRSFGPEIAALTEPNGAGNFPSGMLATPGGAPGFGGGTGFTGIGGGGIGGGGGVGQTPDPTSPLPEPEEWLLLITGFAVVLFALWRRRSALGYAY